MQSVNQRFHKHYISIHSQRQSFYKEYICIHSLREILLERIRWEKNLFEMIKMGGGIGDSILLKQKAEATEVTDVN